MAYLQSHGEDPCAPVAKATAVKAIDFFPIMIDNSNH